MVTPGCGPRGPRVALAIVLGGTWLACASVRPTSHGPAESPLSGSVSFQALVDVIASHRLASIDEILPLLPESLRSNFVLVYNSRSLQEASHKNPRVILYSPDARFIVAFSGDPALGGYRLLETMEFDDVRRGFFLRAIDFPEANGATSGVVVSDVNPPRCLRCHGDDPRPIWDSYPTWPGVYGERDVWPWPPAEAEGFAAFLAGRAANPRYRVLLGAEVLGQRPPRRLTAKYSGQDRLSRNAAFGVKLQQLQYLSIAREVLASPRFPAFSYALLASLDGQCPNIDRFLADPVRVSFSLPLSDFERVTEERNSVAASAKRARLHAADERGVHEQTEALTAFRYLAEQGLGRSTRLWTMAFEAETFDFTSPRPSRSILEGEILAAIVRSDPAMSALHLQRANKDSYCASLRKQSLAATSRLRSQ